MKNLLSLLLIISTFQLSAQDLKTFTFPESNLNINLPESFEVRLGNPASGLVDLKTQVQFVLTSIPAPIQEGIKHLNKQAIESSGVVVSSTEKFKIGTSEFPLFKGYQSQGNNTVQKLILIFGNEKSTDMVMVVFPDKDMEQEMLGYLGSLNFQ